MNYFNVIFLAVFLFAVPNSIFTQSTQDLFSIPGLNITAFQYDDTGGEHSSSYSFASKTVFCDKEVLLYLQNEYGTPMYLFVDGGKVYRVNTLTCEQRLYYDFDLQVGDKVMEGRYIDYEVIGIEEATLLNGEKRKALRLTLGSFERMWIEGIGDTREGFEFFEEFMGYSFYSFPALSCVKIGEEMIWLEEVFESNCQPYGCPGPFPGFEVLKDGLQVGFYNSSYFGEEYVWHFGDGNTSTDSNVVHEYAMPGCYEVILQATNYCNGKTISNAVQVCTEEPWKEIVDVPSNNANISIGTGAIAFWHSGIDLHKSDDTGLTWKNLDFPAAAAGIEREIISINLFDEQNGIAICGHDQVEGQHALFTTEDGGENWSETGPTGVPFFHMASNENGQAWVINTTTLYHSNDFGESWFSLPLPADMKIYNLWLFDGQLFARFLSEDEFFIGKSEDSGNTWTSTLVPALYEDFEFADEQTIYAFQRGFASHQELYKSVDAGESWNEVLAGVNIRHLDFADSDHGWITMIDGQVYYTADGMQTYGRNNCEFTMNFPVRGLNNEVALGVRRLAYEDFDQLVRFDGTFPPLSCLDVDVDNDGFFTNSDCDDNDPTINPDAIDIPDNGIDEDCDGSDLVATHSPFSTVNLQVYPNPANDLLHIKNPDNEAGSWRLRSISGTLLATGELQALTALDVSSFAQGVYMLEVVIATGVGAERVVLR